MDERLKELEKILIDYHNSGDLLKLSDSYDAYFDRYAPKTPEQELKEAWDKTILMIRGKGLKFTSDSGFKEAQPLLNLKARQVLDRIESEFVSVAWAERNPAEAKFFDELRKQYGCDTPNNGG